jgi:hypothetical protein
MHLSNLRIVHGGTYAIVRDDGDYSVRAGWKFCSRAQAISIRPRGRHDLPDVVTQ